MTTTDTAPAPDAPGAAVGPGCGLSVERRTPATRQTMPGGGQILDMENWDYRVALADDQAVLGYRDEREDRAVTVLFADAAAWQLDGFHDLAPDLDATLQHIAQYDLPITEAQVAQALLLIVEACAEDYAPQAAEETAASEPRRLDCAEQCTIPEGAELLEVPPPRHNWGDVLHCPNDGCGKAFLVTKDPRRAHPEQVPAVDKSGA